jgi:hypothetical protein
MVTIMPSFAEQRGVATTFSAQAVRQAAEAAAFVRVARRLTDRDPLG